MSNAFSSSSNPQSVFISVNPGKDIIPNSNLYTTGDFAQSNWPSSAGPSTWQTSSSPNVHHPTDTANSPKTDTKMKGRTPEEQDIISKTNQRFISRLSSDHAAVLYPDVDAPFSDTLDVINRLLPYHVFQNPREDVESLTSLTKGKERAIDAQLKQEISETRFALECFRRREALQDRFRKLKIRSGKRTAPDDQALILAQAVLEADRSETASLNNELRTFRADLERVEKDQRMTTNVPRSIYYGSSPSTTISTQPHYYRGYPYAYTQVYGAPPQSSSTSTFSASPTPHPSHTTPYQAGGAIPVQLPVASLPALHALGIVPVPAASLPPDGQPQPPAVLRGSTSNGTMLSLEINVSLLQQAQMSGLAMVLNSLMSRSSSGAPVGYTANSSGAVPAVPNGTNVATS